MVITYHGVEYVRVQFGETVLAFNPISKDSKHKGSSMGSDIVLVSLHHPDMNGVEAASRGSDRAGEPFIVDGPGAYEIKGISIEGFSTVSRYGATHAINTVYLVTLEGMTLCYLGALGEASLPQEAKEAIDDIDILFVPVGGAGVLSPLEAHKLAVSLEPHVVIPIHHHDVGDKNALALFLKEEGEKNGIPVDKLTIKKKDLEGREGDIIVLAAQ